MYYCTMPSRRQKADQTKGQAIPFQPHSPVAYVHKQGPRGSIISLSSTTSGDQALKHMSPWGTILHSSQQRPCIKFSHRLNSAEIPPTRDAGTQGRCPRELEQALLPAHLAPSLSFPLLLRLLLLPPQVLSYFLQEQNQDVPRQRHPPPKSWHMATSFRSVSPHHGIFLGKGSSLLKRSARAGC